MSEPRFPTFLGYHEAQAQAALRAHHRALLRRSIAEGAALLLLFFVFAFFVVFVL